MSQADALLGGTANGAEALEAELVTDLEEVERLGPAWEALAALERDHDAPFFQSHAWSLHVARIRLARSAGRFRLCVALVRGRKSGRLAGIWPLSLQRAGGLWTARNLDDPFGQLAGVLFEQAEDVAPGVRAVVAEIERRRIADALAIDRVVRGSALHAALLAVRALVTSSNDAVAVDLRAFPDFAAYHKTVGTKTRKNLRNALNRLGHEGPVTHRVDDDRAGIDDIVKGAFDGRIAWMRMLGKSTPAFRDPDFRALVESLPGNPALSLIAFRLACGETPVAQQWGFLYRNRYYAFISARDMRYDAFSPGRIHLGKVVEACKARGIGVLELMAPAAEYKVMFGNRIKPIDDFTRPFTARAHLAAAAHATFVPLARRAFRALPARLKGRLARAINQE